MEFGSTHFKAQKFVQLIVALMLISPVALAAQDHELTWPVAAQAIRINSFDDVIASVIASGELEQARFAESAIEIMADEYRTELDHSARANRHLGEANSSWGIGTLRYVQRLEKIAMSIQFHPKIRIIKEPQGPVRLLIGDEQVMLNAPRPDRQAKFERNIAARVCRYITCRHRGTSIEERVAERSQRLDVGWVFGARSAPTYSSADGLQCIFNDRRHLKLKKDACLDLLDEIRLLKESVLALKVHGKNVDWSQLRVDQVGAGQPQRLVYNVARDFIRIHLPGLARAENVLRAAVPWIKASLRGQVSQHVVKLPNQLVYFKSSRES